MNEIIALAAALLTTGIVAVVHYLGLSLISQRLIPATKALGRRRLPIMIVALVPMHLVGIAVFAGMMQMLIAMDLGGLEGRKSGFGGLLYFSGVCYTSLGFGDVIPHGALELVSIVECVAGLVLIGWSASFTYLEMRALWGSHASPR